MARSVLTNYDFGSAARILHLLDAIDDAEPVTLRQVKALIAAALSGNTNSSSTVTTFDFSDPFVASQAIALGLVSGTSTSPTSTTATSTSFDFSDSFSTSQAVALGMVSGTSITNATTSFDFSDSFSTSQTIALGIIRAN